jgi:sulfinoalanine decarboxylase
MLKDLELFNLLVDELLELEKKRPVADPIDSQRLLDTIDLELREDSMLPEEFAETLRDLVTKTPRTASNLFFNQLFGGRKSKAVLGDLLAVLLNSSMYTYKVAGPQVGVELEVLAKLCALSGFPKDALGTIAPGGSMGNMMGMLMARDNCNPNIQNEGFRDKLIIYTSELSHYSIQKNASFIGLGRDNVRFIPTMDDGRMDVSALTERISEDKSRGYKPMMVNATAGTTVLGAFDPIEEIAALCAKENVWLHVDGAYCGGVVLSKSKRFLIKGIEKADSFTLNAHKLLMTPLTCTVFLTPHKEQMYESFANDADYLYQTDEDSFNLGKTSIQCGRRNDALKLWTMWKSVGTSGMEQIIDRQFELADYAREYVRNHPDYTDYSIDNSISICFNYKDYSSRDICTLLYEHSELMVGFGSFQGTDFIRLVTINANNDKADIHRFFEILEKFCEENAVLFEEAKLVTTGK